MVQEGGPNPEPQGWGQPAPESPPPAAPPPVSWGPPAAPSGAMQVGQYVGGPPPFTVGRLLSDTFARYGADAVRLFLVTAIPSMLSFGVSFLTNPFTNAQAAFRYGGLLGLLAGAISLVAGTTILALLEGGPDLSFTRAVRRGIKRCGWLILTAIVLGLGLFLVFLVFGLIFLIVSVVLRNIAVTFLMVLVLVIAASWVGIRLSLAIVATVVDDLDTGAAIRVSWRATAPAAISLRILGAAFALGLLVVPASFGALVLELPIMFGQLPLLVIPSAILLAALTPLTSALTYSAYRRLVPPTFPPWARIPAPVPGEVPSMESIPPPAFVEPQFDATGKAILFVIVVLDVLGIVLAVYGIGQLLSGAFHLPPFPSYPGSQGFPGFPGFTFPPFPTFRP